MNIPQEFEDIFRGVELAEDEIRTLTWVTGWEHRTVENLRSAIRKAQATALSTLQAENEKLRVEAEGMRSNWYKSVEEIKKLRAELEWKDTVIELAQRKQREAEAALRREQE